MLTNEKELTESEKLRFESLIRDVLNHPFLHCDPYSLDDKTIISDAKQRGEKFNNHLGFSMEYLDQCCSICKIGNIYTAENPYTRGGDSVL